MCYLERQREIERTKYEEEVEIAIRKGRKKTGN